MSTTILSRKTRQKAYDMLARYLSCPTSPLRENVKTQSFECVRRSSSKNLQAANWEVHKVPDALKGMDPAPIAFGPGVHPDDPFFFHEPAQIARGHQFANIPLVIGGTLDEGTDFVPSIDSPSSLLTYFSQTRPGLTFAIETPAAKHALEEFISLYSDDPSQGSPFGTGNETFGRGTQTKRGAAIFGDWLFEAPRREFTREAAKAGLPVWSYQFSQPGYWPPEYGVGHFADVQMIFRWFDENTPKEMAELSNTILDYWFNFVYHLDPNPKDGNLPLWLQYGSQSRSLQLKARNLTMITDDFRQDQIEWLMSQKHLYI
ncbi:carbohydrate esterase family 10 protein [Ceratobasidium sp. AG-Ba]|nr:carbohydrate esterase family 10 protein [Ceratobasidium sp. AG-Ba]